MAIFRDDFVWAAAVMNGATAAFVCNRGFSAAADTGTGDMLLTLDQQLDATERLIFITASKATFCAMTYVNTSDSQLQVLGWDDAGMAADSTQFSLMICSVGPTA